MTETATTIDQVREGTKLAGFTANAVYLDAADRRIGGRFAHDSTGFTVDLVFIETAPQAFVWVNSFPTSDMGEPHTQEHLLLGKGNKGRYVASVEAMNLADSSAFTAQWRTAYHFHTIAGVDAFWELFEHRIDGLLHPDYSDEEIRREVRNFGVATDPRTGELRLEEKGTVYNEMVRSFESPTRLMWRTLGHYLYGADHPLARSSGGLPAAIREMTADDIKRFHRDNYHLANMGMVGAFPRSVGLPTILERLGGALDRQAVGQPSGKVTTERDLPPPASAAAGKVAVVGYPHSNAQKPGSVTVAWPPALTIDVKEQLLMQLFLGNMAGDPSTNLYKALVDSKTRTLDVGATGVWSYTSSDQGKPVYVGVSNVAAEHLTVEGVERIRVAIENQLREIAAWPDDAPELAAFNERIASRIAQTRRGLDKFMNSPPRFGFRGTGSSWMNHLHELDEAGTFERSLTMKPHIAWVEAELRRPGNIWRDYLVAWKLSTTRPYAAASKADPELLARLEAERQARLDAELARLSSHYGTDDAAETLRRYRADYDARTAELEAAGANLKLPGFTDEPPMTLDDALVYEAGQRSGVPIVTSTFESMTGATVGAAFDMRGVPEDTLIYLSVLSPLMTGVGLFENGVALSHEEVTDRLRNEVLSVSVHPSTNFHTGRAELVVRGAGNDRGETERALGWMKRFLHHSDWRPENLARIRDVVDQRAKALRNRMSGAEEGWVNDPANIYDRQTDRMMAQTSSFLTRSHNVFRIRWMLRDANPAVSAVLRALADAGGAGRDALTTLTGDESPDRWRAASKAGALYRALEGADRELADDTLEDLGQLLADVPDSSLAGDWRYLCRQLAADLDTDPAVVLAGLATARAAIVRRGGMRIFAVGSSAVHEAVSPEVDALIASAPAGKAPTVRYSEAPFVLERLRGRLGSKVAPVFVGLVNPDTQSGVFVNSAPGYHYSTREREDLLRYLTSNLYSGHGAHSMFMKTWSAGLAYSNGLRGGLAQARLRYYAERCPELPQTLGFVVEELRKARPDQGLVDYAIAQAFSSRVAASFEGRGEAMAANLADGVTPEMVAGFRKALLELRAVPDLGKQLFDRLESVYGTVLPGYGPPSAEVEGAVYYVIGPDKQLDRWQEYLHRTEGDEATLYRLYPRDYWIPGDAR